MNNEIKDKFGRRLRYLRISVTDRCNFRCKYCMPNNNFEMMECADILRYEDILFASEVFASLGVNRIRITGGEPLIRKDLCQFLDKLTKIDNIQEVMLTTNGSLLNKYAHDLYEAGVKRLNISLDSLNHERNKYITGVDKTEDILAGIKKAAEIGFKPIKVNSVIIRDFNDDEIIQFAELSAKYNIICRFIEFMPIGNSENWNENNIVYGSEILERLSAFEPQEMEKDINSGPAVNYKLNNGGIIGIITPISKHFCSECDKLRITADGKIRPCLLSDNEIDIKKALQSRDKDLLIKQIMQALNIKHDEHNVNVGDTNHDFKRTMSKIGG
ncbi:MAG: GTP 3',8-cyclase MoaA [Mucispirillum sp.]|uniref:GTP 3',8-cyclase n=1 Tax=Candidatus Mucispirillum faecigallinarum TaxID=2838699 RepID=A0A9D2GSU0_9BACT|nr:GTP 3',8-cyclase MoaA [Mucispirillum sp.]HIZ88524.1 GTP 3',8-cyclase MoaA [Candidatus Mucispirillum faecigallinarum]